MTSQPPCSPELEPSRHGLRLVPFSFWLATATLESGDCRAGALAPGSAGPPAEAGALPDSSLNGGGDAVTPPSAAGPPAPSLAALHQAMAAQLAALGHPNAEPLRWAITGADPCRGLRLEGIGLSQAITAAGERPAPAPTSQRMWDQVRTATPPDPA